MDYGVHAAAIGSEQSHATMYRDKLRARKKIAEYQLLLQQQQNKSMDKSMYRIVGGRKIPCGTISSKSRSNVIRFYLSMCPSRIS